MKIAFIGNSHLIAYATAKKALEARHPDTAFSFFALHNQDFFRNAAKNTHALQYTAADVKDGQGVLDLAGPDRLLFEDFDHVYLTAHGFYLTPLLELLATHDILDLRPAGHGTLISWPLVTEFLEARLRYYARRLRDFFPLAGHVTIVQMPYPAGQAMTTHPHLANALAQPDIDLIFKTYNDMIAAHLAPLNARYLPLPPQFLDAPFVTKECYARATEIAPSDRVRPADHTHMNSQFAVEMVDVLLAGSTAAD